MSRYNTFSERIVLPISDYFSGYSISKAMHCLNKSQWWSSNELEQFQLKKLRELLVHASTTVPYYIEYFKKCKLNVNDFTSIADIKNLPIITKEQIRRDRASFISSNIAKLSPITHRSSGSTGEPFEYFTTRRAYSYHTATAIRGWYWMGYKLGDKFIKISNTPRSLKKKIQDLATRNRLIYFGVENVSQIRKIVNEISRNKVSYFRSYPTQLSIILKVAQDSEISFRKMKAINTTGSILHEDLRTKAETAFQCRLFDSYSCEGSAMVFECNTHECYHSAMEYAISEIIPDKIHFNYVNSGRLITTDLWNYAMPFIRYDTQDYIELSDQDCNCGRKLMGVKRIIGRDSDILITQSGKYITPHLVSIFFKKYDIDKFQVIQNSIKDVQIYIVAKKTSKITEGIIIINHWHEAFGQEFDVSVDFVDDISTYGCGKHRYILRKTPIEI